MFPRVLRLSALLAIVAGVSVVHAQTTAPSVAALIKQASRPGSSAARLPLAPATSDLFRGIESLEPVGGHVPNYLRAMALIPGTVGPYAKAFKTLIDGGTVEPETKMAMALEIARTLRSPYAVVHARRMLAASDRGKTLLGHFESGATLRPEQGLAIGYAGWLTADVHGVDDERFRQVRGYYTDAQIVEVTAVVFARKLTRDPASVTDADYALLRAEFGDRGALEVVLQTCNFAFMNRFTDNLGLPSEDEAVKVYHDVYGTDWKKP